MDKSLSIPASSDQPVSKVGSHKTQWFRDHSIRDAVVPSCSATSQLCMWPWAFSLIYQMGFRKILIGLWREIGICHLYSGSLRAWNTDTLYIVIIMAMITTNPEWTQPTFLWINYTLREPTEYFCTLWGHVPYIQSSSILLFSCSDYRTCDENEKRSMKVKRQNLRAVFLFTAE